MAGIFAIILANIIWGAAPPVFKYALQDIPPFTLAFIRFFFAAFLFLPFIIKYFHTIKSKHWIHIILGAIWGVSVNVSFFFVGLEYAPSINVHVFSTLVPIVLYVLSLIILKEQPHPQIMKGIGISLLGVSLIVFAPVLRAGITNVGGYSLQSQFVGNAFFFLSMLGGVLTAIHYKKLGKGPNVLAVTGLQFFIGSIPFIPFMLSELHTWSPDHLHTQAYVGIIYGIFFSSALGYFLHNFALTKMYAQQIGIYAYIMPVVAVIVAIPLLGEYPDIYFIIGALLVFAGMWVSERHPHYQKLHKKLHSK